MKLPDIQGRYIRRYALAAVLARRLTKNSMDAYRLESEDDIDHRFVGWISGGFKAHWPTAIKNRLRRLNRRSNFYFDRAVFFRPRYQRTSKLRTIANAAVVCAECCVFHTGANDHVQSQSV